MDEKKEEFKVRAYNTKQLAGFYGCTPKTFLKWLRLSGADLGPRLGNMFSPRQVQIIIDFLGKPFVWIAGLFVSLMAGGDGGEEQSEQGDLGKGR